MSSYVELLHHSRNARLNKVLAATDDCLAKLAAKIGAATGGRALAGRERPEGEAAARARAAAWPRLTATHPLPPPAGVAADP